MNVTYTSLVNQHLWCKHYTTVAEVMPFPRRKVVLCHNRSLYVNTIAVKRSQVEHDKYLGLFFYKQALWILHNNATFLLLLGVKLELLAATTWLLHLNGWNYMVFPLVRLQLHGFSTWMVTTTWLLHLNGCNYMVSPLERLQLHGFSTCTVATTWFLHLNGCYYMTSPLERLQLHGFSTWTVAITWFSTWTVATTLFLYVNGCNYMVSPRGRLQLHCFSMWTVVTTWFLHVNGCMQRSWWVTPNIRVLKTPNNFSYFKFISS